ncbi:MAG: hypothetical protein ACRDFB_05925 [Rhabdochlamydiaceae bacterium]
MNEKIEDISMLSDTTKPFQLIKGHRDIESDNIQKPNSPALPKGIICSPYIIIAPDSQAKLEEILNAKPKKPLFRSRKAKWIETVIYIPEPTDQLPSGEE